MSALGVVLLAHGIRLNSETVGQHRAVCPECSHLRKNAKDPCLSVTIGEDNHAAWQCWHCGVVGTTKEKRRQEAAVPTKRSPTPVDLARYTVGLLSEKLVEWFGKRGIERASLERFGVVNGRAYIPAHEAEVDVVVFPYRVPGNAAIVNAKFRSAAKHFAQTKGGYKTLFGLDLADPAARDLVITEGEIDALALDTAGVENAVSVPDGAPTPRQGKPADGPIDHEADAKFEYLWNCEAEIAKFERIILAVDNDAPGIALREALARRIGRERCWLVEWPDGCKDANDALVRHGADVVRACIADAKAHPIKSLFEVEAFWDDVLALYRDGRARGLRTGWASIDKLFTVVPGQVTVITGIPNHGKSEWLDALIVNLARLHGWKFALCSFENPPDEHLAKLAEKHVGKPFWDGLTWRMSEAELAGARDWLAHHFVLIRAEDEAPTLDWILEKAGAAVLRHGIRGLVIDPYNEIEHQRPGGMTETEYVSQLLGKLKRFCQNHGVHGWIVAHPQKLQREKDGAYPVPTLYDISGGAHWSNKPDIGVVISRDAERDSNGVTILVRKVRFKWVGQRGEARMNYDRATGLYTETNETTGRRSVVPD